MFDQPPKLLFDVEAMIIWDYHISSILYSKGFFGKPLGLRKTKPGYQARPLVLSPFDAVYLHEYGIIHLVTEDNEILDLTDIKTRMDTHFEEFSRKYLIYKYFRNLGYVVRPGMKFGSDFIIYEVGPGFDHSKWVVHVEHDSVELKAINVVRAGRLAASVKKNYLIATIRDEKVHFYGFERVKI